MAKRRIKKEKLKPNYSYLFGPNGIQLTSNKNFVKSQLKQVKNYSQNKNTVKENPKNTEREKGIQTIKRDIVKSLSLAALILGLEIVLYFVWNKP